MSKEKPIKSILVTETAFNMFDARRKQLDKNSSETLQSLLRSEFTETITMANRIEPSSGFDNEVNKISNKKVGEK